MHVKFNKISNNATGQCVCVTSGFCNRAGGSIYTQSTDGSGLIDMRIITVKVSYLIYLYKHNFFIPYKFQNGIFTGNTNTISTTTASSGITPGKKIMTCFKIILNK